MMRQTSIETFRQIESEGLLSYMRMRVYKIIYENGPLTSGEAFKIANDKYPIGNLTQSRARFTELERMGVIQDIGLKICSVTGRNVTLWQTTNKLPVKLKKEKKIKCKHCKGKGYHLDDQMRMI